MSYKLNRYIDRHAGSIGFASISLIVLQITIIISFLFNLWAEDWHDVVRTVVLFILGRVVSMFFLIPWLAIPAIGVLFVVLRYAV